MLPHYLHTYIICHLYRECFPICCRKLMLFHYIKGKLQVILQIIEVNHLSVFSKLLEKIANHQLYNYLLVKIFFILLSLVSLKENQRSWRFVNFCLRLMMQLTVISMRWWYFLMSPRPLTQSIIVCC